MQHSLKAYLVATIVLTVSFVVTWNLWTLPAALIVRGTIGRTGFALPKDFLLPIVLWFYYLLPAIFVIGPVWYFGRWRVHWMATDYGILVFPFVIWFSLTYLSSQGKSLSNVFVEPFCIGLSLPLAPLVRILSKHRLNERMLSWGLLAILLVVSIVVYFSMPLLPE